MWFTLISFYQIIQIWNQTSYKPVYFWLVDLYFGAGPRQLTFESPKKAKWPQFAYNRDFLNRKKLKIFWIKYNERWISFILIRSRGLSAR